MKQTVWAVPETYQYAIKDREVIECIVVWIKESKEITLGWWHIRSNEDLREKEESPNTNIRNTYELLAKENSERKSREFWLYSCLEEYIFESKELAEKYLEWINEKRDLERSKVIEDIKTTMTYVFDIMQNLEFKRSEEYWLNVKIYNPSISIEYWDEREEFNINNRFD